MPDETEDGPVLENLGAMTVASLERRDLAPDALLLVRIAVSGRMLTVAGSDSLHSCGLRRRRLNTVGGTFLALGGAKGAGVILAG